jgi:hypothetical protein
VLKSTFLPSVYINLQWNYVYRKKRQRKASKFGTAHFINRGMFVEMGGLWKISQETPILRPAITPLYKETDGRTDSLFSTTAPSATRHIFAAIFLSRHQFLFGEARSLPLRLTDWPLEIAYTSPGVSNGFCFAEQGIFLLISELKNVGTQLVHCFN